ncbi:MAG: ABC transporter permease [Chloroflexi bacterium]|nr:ABC transporter permease [Chloroflexota bacterium]
MGKFLLRRLVFVFISMIGATAVVFSLSRLAGDPVLLYAKPAGYGSTEEYLDGLRKHLGTDKPLVVQYVRWLGQIVRGDMGRTLLAEQPVARVIRQKIGATFQLAFAGWLLATIVGVPLGILSAVKRGTAWDYIGRVFALFGQSIPPFAVGIVLILIFAVHLEWLPAAFKGDGISIKHFILPAITIGWASAAAYLRITRSAMLEVLDSEYIKLARAKGVSSSVVVWKHAFKNAIIPPLTFSFVLLAGLLNGAVVAEVVFAWPGIGRVALLEAVNNNDFPLLMGAVLVFSVIYLVVNFLADMLYAWVDPRIRYS